VQCEGSPDRYSTETETDESSRRVIGFIASSPRRFDSYISIGCCVKLRKTDPPCVRLLGYPARSTARNRSRSQWRFHAAAFLEFDNAISVSRTIVGRIASGRTQAEASQADRAIEIKFDRHGERERGEGRSRISSRPLSWASSARARRAVIKITSASTF